MNCKNCNEEIVGKEKYCSNCGQKNIEKLNLKYLLKEVLDNVFELDSKLFRTLKQLILKPGVLSKEYISGKRAQYVPPIRLYVILSVIFFFLISVLDIPSSQKSDPSEQKNGFTIKQGDGFEISNSKKLNVQQDESIGGINLNLSKSELKRMDYEGTLDNYLDSITSDSHPLIAYLTKKSAIANLNDSGFSDIARNQISLFLLIFLPFLALLYATCFSRNKIGFIGHLIFNLHLNSFVIFSLSIWFIINEFIANDLLAYLWIIFVFVFGQIYFIRGVIKFYERKWWVALYKYFLLGFGYLILMVVFGIAVLFSTIIMV